MITASSRGTIYRAPTTEQFGQPTPGSLPTIIRTYKSAVTRHIRQEHEIYAVWQRNYWEHIIRDNGDLQRITTYIESNPLNWEDNTENPRKL